VHVENVSELNAVDFVSRSHVFFGRTAELETLVTAIPSARRGRPLVRLVVGSAGVGKSALLQRVAARLTSSGALVLSSRCKQQGSAPYRAISGVLDDLARHLAQLPKSALAGLVPSHADLMARSFPQLLRARAFAEFCARAEPRASAQQPLNPLEQRNRAFLGLRDLLDAACTRQPVVIALDDMHWVDGDSLSLLHTLLTGPSAPPLSLLATLYPEDERSSPEYTACASELQRMLASSGEPLILTGLDARAGRLLAEHLLGASRPAQPVSAEGITREAGGHPALIERWIELLKEGSPQAARSSLGDVLRDRLAQLRPAAVQLAVLLGLAETSVPLNVLAHAARLDLAEVAREAATLRLSRLCRITQGSDGARIELSHDRVRDAVLSLLGDADRGAHHAALARAYAALHSHDHEALGNHLQLSGQPAQAAEVFATAADRALEALAFARAARLYRKSIALTGVHTSAERHARLGDALTSWGRAAEGARAYLAAADGGDSPAALDLRRRAMEQLLVCGDASTGPAAAAQLLQRLRLPVAGSRAYGLLRSGLRWLKLRATGFSFTPHDASELAAEDLLRIDTSWSLFVGFAAADPARSHDPLSLHLSLALRSGEPMRVARGLAGFAIAFELTRGQTALSQELIERAETLSERLDHPHLRGLCHLHAGVRAFHAGHNELAKASLERAELAFQHGCRGTPWELAVTQFLTLLCHLTAGDVRTLSRLAQDWHEEALARGDITSADNMRFRVLPAVALLAGDVDAARRVIAPLPAAPPGKYLNPQPYWREVCLVECDLFEGKGADALRRVRALWPQLRRSPLLTMRAVHFEAHWLRARAALMALDDGDGRVDPRKILADAGQVETSDMGGARGLAWALRGALAQRAKERSAAESSFRRAEIELSESGRLLVSKLARLRRGLLGADDEAGRVRREAELWLAGAGVSNTPAMLRVMIPGGLRA
jgi:hypothetical protein